MDGQYWDLSRLNRASNSPFSNFVKFVDKVFGLVEKVCFVVAAGGGSVSGVGNGGVSSTKERVNDAPLSIRSMSVFDPCIFPSSFGS